MSRELIIKCDKCGTLIEGDPYRVVFWQEGRESFGIYGQSEINKDLCQECVKSLQEQISKFFEPEPEPEDPKLERAQDCAVDSPKERPKRTIDGGKVKALYLAGWPVKEIADEMGITAPTVYNWLNKLGLRGEKDENCTE